MKTEPTILIDWKDIKQVGKSSSAFRNKQYWMVDIPSSRPLWYSAILGNLTGYYIYSDPASIDRVRSTLHQGFPRDAFDRLKSMIGVTTEDLGRAINIPVRTLARKKTFKPDESERILRVASCFQKALDVLGGREKARKWFSSPKRALGGKTPLEFCDTNPGAEAVEHLLGRIEHGVFS